MSGHLFDEKLVLVGEDGADWSPFGGTSYIISGKSWVNNHVHVLRCTDIIEEFLSNYLDYIEMRQVISGTNRGKLNQSELNQFPVLYPPLPEQRRIADILSTVDEKVQQTDEIIKETKELKRGLRDDLVLGGQSNTENQRFRVGPFDFNIPNHWEKTTIKECTDNRDSERIPVKKKNREEMAGEFPYYGASGQIDSVNDWIFNEELLLLAEDGENLLSREKPVAFKISGKTWVNNHAHVLKPNPDMNIDYLRHYFEILNYEPYATGTAQPKLNQKVLNSIDVPKPPISEQESIAKVLRSVEEKIDQESSKRSKLKELKRGLMQDLLTGKVRTNTD